MLARFETSPDDGTLFLTVDGTVCSPGWLTQMARGYVTRAAIGKTGACHLFRHTMATLMLEGGANVRYIQAILGHSRLETTELCTRVSIRHLQAVHVACHLAAENVRHRSPNHPTLHLAGPAEGPDEGPDGDVAELWAVLDQETEEENRPGPADVAVEALEGLYGPVEPSGDRDTLDAFIGCGSSGRREPFDIRQARSDLAARKLAAGA